MVTRAGHGFVHPSAVAQSRAARTPSTFAPSLSTTLAHFWPRHSRFPTAVALVLRFATLYWTCIWQFILLPVVSRTRLRTLVPKRMPNHTPVQVDQQMHNPTWDYDVWKPMSVTAAKFKPSDPPRPDFAVSVLSAERLAEHGLPHVEANSDGFAEHLVAVVNQASVHFYAIAQKGNYVIGDS
ncbi:hypothetical protein BCR44DRAFT_1042373 [Catenaria anguillulae PL171]|uniref:Uncharacterized protein n=1 Tax=Catenaria anguillulae PL171 TaxID=765915 RepID=A0A1Y2HRT9_9FUNG|nr:hypothetical protein BCR44DRAFT_1042373 [Catenaria anguillulae PL171]